MQTQENKRCGMIAVVGRASVGKSTLVNRFLGEKVSIISPVAQTTRTLIRGILTEPRGQLVFLDTPGVHRATYDLGRIMNRIARASIEGVDVVMLVLDASEKPGLEDDGWIRRLLQVETPVVAVLNKTDMKSDCSKLYLSLWHDIAHEKSSGKEATWMPASGLTGHGIKPLLDLLFTIVPQGPLLFPEDVLTDHPRKLNMADIVREKYFAVLHDELPHALAVEIEEIDESPERWSVRGTIFVQKNSQKGIVLGHKGRLIRQVKAEAETELAEMYGHPVSLDLWVKVSKDWPKNYWMLKRLGYAT